MNGKISLWNDGIMVCVTEKVKSKKKNEVREKKYFISPPYVRRGARRA